MRTRCPVFIWVEAKEETTGEGAEPAIPAPEELSRRLTDVLADQTKHDGTIGWRVVSVEHA